MTNQDPAGDGDEELILPGPDSGWIRVATKVDGHAYWEDGWHVVESLVFTLQFLQELPGHKPDWDFLLKDLILLQPLRVFEFPLNDFSDFLELEGFLNIHHSHLGGVADHLFFDESATEDQRNDLLRECAELTRRLRHYEPLSKCWGHMA